MYTVHSSVLFLISWLQMNIDSIYYYGWIFKLWKKKKKKYSGKINGFMGIDIDVILNGTRGDLVVVALEEQWFI